MKLTASFCVLHRERKNRKSLKPVTCLEKSPYKSRTPEQIRWWSPESCRTTGMMTRPTREMGHLYGGTGAEESGTCDFCLWYCRTWQDQFCVLSFLTELHWGRVTRSRCKVRGEAGTGGSKNAQWKETEDSSPQRTCTGSGGLEVGGKGQSPSLGPCSTCCVCHGCCGSRLSSGPLMVPARPAGGEVCSHCHRRQCCRAW